MSVQLAAALSPVMHILTDPTTEDLAIQQPGVGWWLHHGEWHRVDLPAMTFKRLHGVAVMTAAQRRQEITPRNPIVDEALLENMRMVAVMPPAVPQDTMALTFRRGDLDVDPLERIPGMYETSRWNKWGGRLERQRERDGALLERYDAGDLEGFLRGLAETRQTGLFVGPTGAGKTRLSKAIVGAIPENERIITIEDAAEMQVRQANAVRLFYSSSDAGVPQASLLKATLRMRPHRIMLAEIRDPEAASVFLSEVGLGHPGSYSTLHARTAAEAGRRLFNLLTDGIGEGEAAIGQLEAAIDFIMPVENDGGSRTIGEVWFRADAARRGETFRNLLGER